MRRAAWLAAIAVSSAMAGLAPCGARAQEARYDVVVDASAPLKALIEDNLALARYRDDGGRRGRIDEGELRRLFDQGRDEIGRLVATEGYYVPDIDADLAKSDDRWTAHYRLVPNARTRVGAVDLQFVGPITQAPKDQPPDLSALRDGWTLKSGDAFRQPDWEGNKRKLLQGVLLNVYPFATITRSEAEVDVRTATAKLTVVIASGPAVRFGPLQIEGLKRYPDSIVRNVETIRLGELYSQQKLLDFQQKLNASGYFSRVEVSVDAEADPGSDPRTPFVPPAAGDGAPTPSNTAPDAPPSPLPREVTLPIRVFVVENKSQQVSFGVGYSSNTGPHASATYNVFDFLGGAKQLRNTLAVDPLNQSFGVDLLFPPTAAGNRYSISTNVLRTNVQNEVTRSATVSGKVAWGPDETQRFRSIDTIIEQKSIPDTPNALAQTLGYTEGISLRRTDSLLAPTTGYLLSAQAGGGVRLTNARPFARAYGKGLRYFPLGVDNTLLVRLEGGVVVGRDTVSLPSALLFRGGGDGSVRGYGYQSLGVRQAGAIVGGRYLATGTVELIHWLGPRFPEWGVAGFVDAGNAGNQLSDLSPVVGYGVGARWRSPVGTLDLDVAHGIQNGSTRIHFSLGVSF